MKSKRMRTKTRRKQQLRKTRKGGKKISTFKKVQCAPKPTANEIQNFTCYSEKDLIKMRDLWNARHRDMHISDTNPAEASGLLDAEAYTKLIG